MKYYYSKTINKSHTESIDAVTEDLKSEGFGIVSTIDMQAKLKEKLGVGFKKYTILGACNPPYTYRTLLEEEKIGLMLPCNVVVIEKENGTIEVAAVNPLASMLAVENPALEPIALEVNDKIKRAIQNL